MMAEQGFLHLAVLIIEFRRMRANVRKYGDLGNDEAIELT